MQIYLILIILCASIHLTSLSNHYHHNSQPQFNTAQQLLTEFKFSGSETILDIGCGSGATSLVMASKVPDGLVIGLDPSANMIESAHALGKNTKNILFVRTDILDFKLDKPVDLITAFSCFHWIENQQALLHYMSQNLKIGGHLLITMAQKVPIENEPLKKALINTALSGIWRKLMPEYMHNFQWPLCANALEQLINKQIHAHTKLSFTDMLVQADLRPLQIEEITLVFNYNSKQKFTDWILGWMDNLPMLSKLSPDQLKQFAVTVTENYCSLVPIAPNGNIEYSAHRLLIHAQK